MATPEIPQELLGKLAGQVVQDPGIPVPNPTTSAWQELAHPLAGTQSKELPQRVDFAIIRSGITGCSAAKTIFESNLCHDKSVIIFEARSLTTGATSRNGGFLMSHVPQFFGRFSDAFGPQAAKDIAKFCDFTLKEIVRVAMAENLAEVSEIRDVTTVATFEDEEGFAKASRSVRIYEKAVHGSKEIYEVIDGPTAEKVKLYFRDSIEWPKHERYANLVPQRYHFKKSVGALVLKSGVCWPYRLITNLLQRLLERYSGRFTVETKTPVTSVTVAQDSDNAYPYIVNTPRGAVRAAKVFHCVNGFARHLLPKLRGPLFPCRLSMSTQKPGP